MIEENELLMLLLGVITLVFISGNTARLARVPGVFWLGGAFISMLLGWIFTLLEGFVLLSLFNFMEHFCYMAGSILLVCWLGVHARLKGPSR